MRNKRLQFNISELNFLLLLSSFFSCGLVFIRVTWSLTPTYLSLIWNLFLAWIPYIFSYFLRKKIKLTQKKIIFTGSAILWLLFFPNAPYIVTDLFHLHQKPFVPLWYDLILIVSFALNGLILGILSLKHMQQIITLRYNYRTGWWFAILVLLLSGFGVYLGRFLRWNSWDVFTQTYSLAIELWNIASDPILHIRAYAFTFLFSTFLILMYYSLHRFIMILRKDTSLL